MHNPLLKALFKAMAVTSLAATLLASGPVAAKTYKWVDENGQTHYSATPPPAGDFKEIKAPPPPAIDPATAQENLDRRLKAYEERRDEAAGLQKEADTKKAADKDNKAKCEQAKKNQELLLTKVRVRYKEKDGSTRYLDDEEREAQLKRARDAVKEFCK